MHQPAPHTSNTADVPAALPSCRSFVFCRQRQDEALRRGGEQNSVVVLSEHPFSSALLPLSQIAGPLYFNQVGSTGLHRCGSAASIRSGACPCSSSPEGASIEALAVAS
jgi:hypothetical protein